MALKRVRTVEMAPDVLSMLRFESTSSDLPLEQRVKLAHSSYTIEIHDEGRHGVAGEIFTNLDETEIDKIIITICEE